jgi:putative component of membrane protein insertase Oxa1/YidC/SpoIIIJ protein YidD
MGLHTSIGPTDLKMKRIKTFITAMIFFVIICSWRGIAATQDALPPAVVGDLTNPVADESNPVLKPLRFITGIISRADGDRCPMVPTCSTYSAQAIQKHGLLMGWIMTSDRLMRCGRDELHLSDTVLINGRKRSHDPVSNNDFWW